MHGSLDQLAAAAMPPKRRITARAAELRPCGDKLAKPDPSMRYDLLPRHLYQLPSSAPTTAAHCPADRQIAAVVALHSMGQRHQGGWAGLRALQQRYLQAQLTSKHARSPSAVAAPKRPVAEQPPAAAVDR